VPDAVARLSDALIVAIGYHPSGAEWVEITDAAIAKAHQYGYRNCKTM